jgi:hypothetical protein
MRDGREPGQRAVEQLARRAPAGVRDQADTAGVALAGGVVEWRGHRVKPPFGSVVGDDRERASRLV